MAQFLIKNQQDMSQLAEKVAVETQPGDIILLKGTLGAGKSFFARSFINALSEENQEVLSPTFNLVYSYETNKGEIFHFDLYRLKDARELENIGFFDALSSGICLIEWPDIAETFIKKGCKEIEISMRRDLGEEGREVIVT